MISRFSSDPAVAEIGVDESGRGPMFGRLYAAAVCLPATSFDHSRMRDSKKIKSKKQMRELAAYIREHALAFHVGFVDEGVIDATNILRANMECMHACIREVVSQVSGDMSLILVDGNYFAPLFIDGTPANVQTVVGGDAKHSCIAAASILAKDARDTYILELCEQYPLLVERYGLNTNMGYGSARHMSGIATHGISQFHRRSFGLCKSAEINPC